MAARVVGALLAAFVAAAHAAPVDAIDDLGQHLRLPRPAQRIVSLAPHATELIYAAGAGAKLVGAVSYSDYPAAALAVPRVGDTRALDLERIVALKPDLIVVWLHGNSQRQLDVLRAMGLPLYYDEPHRLEDIARSIDRLGRLAGTDAEAGAASRAFLERLDRLRRDHAGRRPVSVFYEVWYPPLMTINGSHVISDVIGLCGGRNIFAEQPMLVPQPAVEAVIERDPEVIMAAGTGDAPADFRLWRDWPQMRAVRDGALVTIPGDWISRHTPRLLDAAERVCTALEAVRTR